MSITKREIELVKNTWGVVITGKKEVGEIFYNKLFEIAPGVKHLFKSGISEQAKKLVSMVTVIVTKLDKLDDVLVEVSALAKRHNKYGAQSSHYSAVGQALLYTLKTSLKDKWDEETELAWTNVYQILSKGMIEVQVKNLA